MGGKLQQSYVILQRSREVVSLVDDWIHCEFHVLPDANVGGVDAGDVVLPEDERHRPLGEEGEGGDAVSRRHRPVRGDQRCRTTSRPLAWRIFHVYVYSAPYLCSLGS